jgi:putative intracellular protease/amidase
VHGNPRSLAARNDQRIDGSRRAERTRRHSDPGRAGYRARRGSHHAKLICTGTISIRDLKRRNRARGVEELESGENQEFHSAGHGRKRGYNVIYDITLLAHNDSVKRRGNMSQEFPIVFALYPRVTQLDFTGPYEVFARLPGARSILASTTGNSVEADGGMTFSQVRRLADVDRCALLCVPGGFGTVEAMEDIEYLDQLRRLAGQAQYVTSVCSGSLLLGAAGLLWGKRAACHWAWRDLLPVFGATPDPTRVVRDGNVITGGGVTAGIDMALTVVGEIAGADFAEVVQLAIEYAPAPPFDAGRPERARPQIVAAARRRLESNREAREAAARRASSRLPVQGGVGPR